MQQEFNNFQCVSQPKSSYSPFSKLAQEAKNRQNQNNRSACEKIVSQINYPALSHLLLATKIDEYHSQTKQLLRGKRKIQVAHDKVPIQTSTSRVNNCLAPNWDFSDKKNSWCREYIPSKHSQPRAKNSERIDLKVEDNPISFLAKKQGERKTEKKELTEFSGNPSDGVSLRVKLKNYIASAKKKGFPKNKESKPAFVKRQQQRIEKIISTFREKEQIPSSRIKTEPNIESFRIKTQTDLAKSYAEATHNKQILLHERCLPLAFPVKGAALSNEKNQSKLLKVQSSPFEKKSNFLCQNRMKPLKLKKLTVRMERSQEDPEAPHCRFETFRRVIMKQSESQPPSVPRSNEEMMVLPAHEKEEEELIDLSFKGRYRIAEKEAQKTEQMGSLSGWTMTEKFYTVDNSL